MKKEYLATALQAIEKEFGSVEGYLFKRGTRLTFIRQKRYAKSVHKIIDPKKRTILSKKEVL